MNTMTVDSRIANIIHWIRSTTDYHSGRGVLIPISGGSDSALCFWLCAQALPRDNVFSAYIGDDLRCKQWFEDVGNVAYLPKTSQLGNPEIERWSMLLSYSLKVRGWLAGTRNRTEDVFGTFSLASRVATYLPLVTLWKTEVMELAEKVGVPKEILESSKRADPSCGRPKQMSDIPFSVVDNFLKWRIGECPLESVEGLDPEVRKYLESVYQRNTFKSRLPMRPALEIAQSGTLPK